MPARHEFTFELTREVQKELKDLVSHAMRPENWMTDRSEHAKNLKAFARTIVCEPGDYHLSVIIVVQLLEGRPFLRVAASVHKEEEGSDRKIIFAAPRPLFKTVIKALELGGTGRYIRNEEHNRAAHYLLEIPIEAKA